MQLPWLWGRELHERGMPWHVAACPGGWVQQGMPGAPLDRREGNGFVPLWYSSSCLVSVDGAISQHHPSVA